MGDGRRRPLSVGLTELHANAFEAGHFAAVAEDLGGCGEVFEVCAFFTGVASFFVATDHFVCGAAVEGG